MKRVDFNELIEKAFSLGYEEAQKEFGNKENKRKRKEWEWKEADKIGQRMMRDGISMSKGDAIRAQRLKNLAETHGGVGRYFDDENNPYDIYSNAILEAVSGNKNGRNVHHRINTRSITRDHGGKITKKSFLKTSEQDAVISDLGNSDSHINTDRYETIRTGGKRERDFIRNNKKEENSNIKKNILDKKNLKKAGLIGAGILGTGVAAYAGKKAYDKYKAKKQKEQEEKENKNK